MAEMPEPVHCRTKKRTHYGPVAQWVGRTWLRVFGWRLVGENPHVAKCVVVCAPHTSNWDFPDTLAAAMAMSIPCVFMIKDTAFWWPLGVILRWLGGIPINRRAPQGVVEQMVQVIRESNRINVIVTPEGTRTNVEYWKLGFYHIAVGAGVPILFGIGSRKEKWIGVADLFYPTGNLEEDWKHITEIFQQTVGVTPKYRVRNMAKSASNMEAEDMGKISSSDRCSDCTHCSMWSTDHNKASCNLYHEQGFHPDRPVPQKCVNQVTRKY